MVVKKKIETSVNSFIDKGADVKASKYKEFQNILVRVPIGILNELDSSVEKKPWLTRTQWVVEAINEKLKSDFNEEEQENSRTGNQ
jgi:hypothetical protein